MVSLSDSGGSKPCRAGRLVVDAREEEAMEASVVGGVVRDLVSCVTGEEGEA